MNGIGWLAARIADAELIIATKNGKRLKYGIAEFKQPSLALGLKRAEREVKQCQNYTENAKISN